MKLSWILCLLVVAPAVSADLFEVAMNAYSLFVSGGRILHDVAGGMGLLSKLIHSFDYFLDYSAEEQIAEALEDTADTTSTVSENQKSSKTTSSSSQGVPSQTISGCGVLGLQITDDSLPTGSLTSCCNAHDVCYASSCNVNKRKCDQELGDCLKNACDDLILERQVQKNCQGAAKLLYSGTMALSSQQFGDAQEKLSCRKEGKRRGGR